MQTLSSASRTCMASASAVECTATVGMPRSLQARNTRNAISPRLAIRIFSNMAVRMTDDGCQMADDCGFTRLSPVVCHLTSVLSFYNHQRLAKLHRLRVLEQDLDNRAGLRRGNLVEGLHRLDDQERIARLDRGAHVAERLGAGLGRPIGSADHRRCHDTWMLGRIERPGRYGGPKRAPDFPDGRGARHECPTRKPDSPFPPR